MQADYSGDHLSGTAVTGSNFCVAGRQRLRSAQRCYRLDAATGRTLGEFGPRQADGRTAFGASPAMANDCTARWPTRHIVRFAYVRADASSLLGESKTFFALDAKTGRLLWRYDAEHSIRHNAVAAGPDRIFLIDRPLANDDKWDPKNTATRPPPVTRVDHPPGTLLALDSQTGEPLWKLPEEAFGTMLMYSAEHDALLMGYQATRFKLPSEVGGRLAMFRGADGQRLWDKAAKYITRPLINGEIVYAQGGAWDLLTGEERPFELERSYGCGQLAGSKHLLLFRSATLGYLDLNRGSGVENFGGLRPALLDQHCGGRAGPGARRLGRLPLQLPEPFVDRAGSATPLRPPRRNDMTLPRVHDAPPGVGHDAPLAWDCLRLVDHSDLWEPKLRCNSAPRTTPLGVPQGRAAPGHVCPVPAAGPAVRKFGGG